MPENWKAVKLNEVIVSANTGLDAIKRAPIVDVDTGIKCLRIQDVSQDKEVEKWGNTRVTPENYKKFALKKGEIIIARTGNTIGVNKFISEDLNSVFNNGLIRLRFDKKICDPKYIFYNFRSYFFKAYIQAIAFGTSTQPNMQINSLLSFEFNLPPLQEQKSIASILSALDDKIELNLQMNKTLEEMAMALYKHWFVDFGPFQDGEFMDSELGEIPKGWEVTSINAFGKVICGKTPSKKDPDNFTLIGGYPFIKIPEMHGNVFLTETVERVSEKGNQTQAKKLLPSGCINVSCIATVGLVTINAIPSHTNQQINSIIPEKTIYRYYLYSTMISLKERFLNEASGGSATLNMNTSTFSNIEILKPDEETLQKFSEKTTSIYSKILQNQEENQTLTQLRDTLLPKLISGEVRVKDAEKTLSEVL